jgi:hypothetical protein
LILRQCRQESAENIFGTQQNELKGLRRKGHKWIKEGMQKDITAAF